MAHLTFHCTMAEFVGAIVGLAVAGATVGDSLYAVVDTIRDAPTEFLALSDELTDFRAMLARVIEAKTAGDVAFEENGRITGLDQVMVRGEGIIQQIEQFVQKVSKQCRENQGPQVNRIKWLRRVKRATKLKEILRVQKLSICNFLALSMM